jgi:1,4-alpha-glucan branching enzyme
MLMLTTRSPCLATGPPWRPLRRRWGRTPTPRGAPGCGRFLPGAVQALCADGSVLARWRVRHADGVFEGRWWARSLPPTSCMCAGRRPRITFDDPYRFGPVLGELDAWLLAEGTHLRPFEMLGATPRDMDGVAGTGFAVWAPNASARQRGRRLQPLGRPAPPDAAAPRVRRVGAVPARRAGRRALQVRAARRQGQLLPQKADPYARAAELRPATASVVAPLPAGAGAARRQRRPTRWTRR